MKKPEARMHPLPRQKADLREHMFAQGRPRAVPFYLCAGMGYNISPVACVFNVSMKNIRCWRPSRGISERWNVVREIPAICIEQKRVDAYGGFVLRE
jgi:hypothetical protein